MHIVAISDTHNKHTQLKIPYGDILIHAGDFSSRGSLSELESFNSWLGTLPHPYKIMIAGNHDFCFQNQPYEARKLVTDFLITHGPPYGYGDQVQSEMVGCVDLIKRVLEVKPKMHICGHIHEGYGKRNFENIVFLNASVCNERYQPLNLPLEIDL